MEWVSCLNETLSYIERNLCQPLDVCSVSNHVHYSPVYLQKGFQVLTGYTIGEYIRCRRLYEAAMDLIHTDEKIIDIAFRYGYDTPESFTKAFTRFHDASPMQVRRDASLIHRFLPLKIHIEITGGDRMNYQIAKTESFQVIGFSKVFSSEDAYSQIPKYWDAIIDKYISHLDFGCPRTEIEQAIVTNRIGEFGVCVNDMGSSQFRYFIAGSYRGGNVPEGMELLEIPGADYAQFTCTGPIPTALQTMNTRIFKEWLPGNPEYELSGSVSLEWYSPEGQTTDQDYKSQIWIPVKHR